MKVTSNNTIQDLVDIILGAGERDRDLPGRGVDRDDPAGHPARHPQRPAPRQRGGEHAARVPDAGQHDHQRGRGHHVRLLHGGRGAGGRVLLALPRHHAHARPQAAAGGPLGADHEGHGRMLSPYFRAAQYSMISNIYIFFAVNETILDDQSDVDS